MKKFILLLFSSIATLSCINGIDSNENNLLVCEDIFEEADPFPQIIGGKAGIQARLKYPDDALREGIEGTVTVQLVVDKLGYPDSVRVIHGIGGGCDQESFRLIQSSSWTPGKVRGKAACVKIETDIIFELSD